MRRVVITGLGPVCARQRGKEGFWNMMVNMECPVEPIPSIFEKNYTYRTRFYIPAPTLTGYDKSMEDMSKVALECTKLALEDAQMESLEGAGVILGVGMAALGSAFTSYVAHTTAEGRFNRMVIPLSMPSAPAALISLKYGADKECYTVNAACASGTIAIGEAYRRIAWGILDCVLTGGVECLSDPAGATLRGFDHLQALTLAKDGFPRPFSRSRSGFLINMGAGCTLILEELEKAQKRGAHIYAEVVGYACNSAADTIVQMPASYSKLLPLFSMAKGYKIDYFNAHGTGTVQNDLIEAQLIRHLWGGADTQPVINTTKSIIGHSIGASGALEAAVTAMSIKEGMVHGNLTDEVEEELNIPLSSQEVDIKYALSASYGFGGHNSVLFLKRYDL